ncbi:ABC transporter ATP-binding protein [Alicyclobacillus acidiphilus]|uniref:ABC transporter ATP-binding protein n=1 Tax=Alicyclobacillus acidiphilus TaxID=182455 RepID=UPI000836FB1A|nr:ABC transporter ATP-binding protein [Alicyclobacillus acidiphilus]
MTLLQVEQLTVAYGSAGKGVKAVRGVSFQLEPGEFLGIVGESGSGKSTLGYAVSNLLRPPGQVVGGRVLFDGKDLLNLPKRALKQLRWAELSIVMQSGMNALNPVLTIKRHFEDTILSHATMPSRDIEARIRELLGMVEIDPAFMHRFPHELSGGMKQRVSIALALALGPKLIIFDEPTTALDVVVQRSIVQNLKALQRQHGFAALFISHDLGTVLEIANRVAVMYAGEFVEVQDAKKLLQQPMHPYTQALLKCFPDPQTERLEITGIPGTPPDLKSPSPGCPFEPRCTQSMPNCRTVKPTFVDLGGTGVACHVAVIGAAGGTAHE